MLWSSFLMKIANMILIQQESTNHIYVMDISDSKVKFGFDSQFGDMIWLSVVLGNTKNLN